MKRTPPLTRGSALIALILVQSFCAIFFLSDILGDIASSRGGALADFHLVLELTANLGLCAGIAFEAHYLMRMLRRQARDARVLSAASGALHDLIDSYFADWGLTAAEADVAAFTIKGFSIAEVAELRGSAEGTVKTHLNAIYRKAGVTGRGQLTSMLIEDLMGKPLVPGGRVPTGPAQDDPNGKDLRAVAQPISGR